MTGVATLGLILGLAYGAAQAANVPVVPTKLIVVDKLTKADKAKTVFVVKDPAVTKGDGVDPDLIGARLYVDYATSSAAGAFVVLPGASADKSPGWLVNKDTVAKYVNKSAPGGPTEAKVVVIKPGKVLKLVGKGLGDQPLDIFSAGDPAGAVYTSFCVNNAGTLNCHCSEFDGCVYKLIAGDTGAKLVCKGGIGEALCQAAFSEQWFDANAGPALCAKFAECIDGFDEEACNNPENPVDTSSCTYNTANAQECFAGIPDSECGTAEEFFIPHLPAACDSVYTDCGDP